MFEGFTKIQSVSIRKFSPKFRNPSEDSVQSDFKEEITISSQLILKRELKIAYKGRAESTKLVEVTFNFEDGITPSASAYIEAYNAYNAYEDEGESEDETFEPITIFEPKIRLTVQLPKTELQEFLKYLNTDFFIFISGNLNNTGHFQLEKTWLHLELQDFEYVYLINQKQVRWYFDGIESIAASYLKKLSIGQRGQVSQIVNELSESAANQGYILDEYDKDLETIIDLVSDLRSALRSHEPDPSADYDYGNIWYLNATDFQSAIKELPDSKQKELIEKYDQLWKKVDLSHALKWGEDKYGAIAVGFDPKQDEIENVAYKYLKLKTLRSKELEKILINSLIYTETIAFARTILSKKKFWGMSIPSIIESKDVEENSSRFQIFAEAFWEIGKLTFFEAIKVIATFAIAFVVTNENFIAAWIVTTGYTVFRWWRQVYIASLTPEDAKRVLLGKMIQVHKLSNNYNYDAGHLKDQLLEVSREGAVFSPYVFSLLDFQIDKKQN
jgi:hypothetical protein